MSLQPFLFNRGRLFPLENISTYLPFVLLVIQSNYQTKSFSNKIEIHENMNNNNTLTNFDQYHADIQSIIDSYVTSGDYHSTQNRKNSSSLITFDRDPAISENLTDELRWLLIQYGPHQPRDNEEQFLASAKLSNKGKGMTRFRMKWFDDVRFSDWLEYSLSTCRAYCFYCRLFVDSNRNRAFSRDGIQNWRKCMGSRGQKKKRLTGADQDTIVCQRRGLLESHAMSESHKQAYNKYLAFIDQMRLQTPINDEEKQDGDSNVHENIKHENPM